MNKPLNTSDEILACARNLIMAGGYNGFSYADIATVVGIRMPSIHHHFPTKLDLVKTLLAGYRREAEEGFKHLECAIPDSFAQLHAYVQYWKTCIGDLRAPFCVCALLAGELPILPDEVALEVRAYFHFLSTWLTAVLDRAVQQGVISLRYDARLEAEALMATLHGAMLSARAYGDADIFDTVMRAQLERMAVEN